MKKTIVLMLFVTAMSLTGMAQEEQDWRQIFPRHELSLGIGDPAMANFQKGWLFDKLIWDRWYDQGDNLNDWFNPIRYHSDYIATCPISLGYMFRLRKFLWLGASVSYMGTFGKVFDARDNSFICNHTETQVAFLPSIRFSYLNKKYVTLYSGVSTGFLLNFEKEDGPVDIYFHPAWQFTLFCISAGHKFYGFTEIGCGFKGFIHAGIGYRFNAKNE
ncbi:MAG: hypothetical protein K5846_06010 [Bacteroidales bacterium]|nr:hypothetical protein [Bacteroidales bacterium]